MSETAAAEPLVSVIIPVYNAAKYLRETLDCVCNQTLRNIEIICVDDGSTDDSLGILQEYAARDGRFRILQQKNQYAGVARNNGMAAARGKYLSFLDADDLFEPDMLERMSQRAEATGSEIVFCKATEFYESLRQRVSCPEWLSLSKFSEGEGELIDLQGRHGDQIFDCAIGWTWDKLFLADFVKRNGLSFPGTRHCNDAPFVFPAMGLSRKASLENRELVHHRKTGGSLEATREKAPSCIIKSIDLIESKLHQENLPSPVMDSFRNWRMCYLTWSLFSMRKEGRPALINSLKGDSNMWDRVQKGGASSYRDCKTFMQLQGAMAPHFSCIVHCNNDNQRVVAEIVQSVLEHPNAACEVVVESGEVPEAWAQDPRVHGAGYVPKGTGKFRIPTRRGLLPTAPLEELASLQTLSSEVWTIPSKYTYNIPLRQLFFIKTKNKVSFRLFGCPFLTVSVCKGEKQLHIFGCKAWTWAAPK